MEVLHLWVKFAACHFHSMMTYVTSEDDKQQPNFQHYLENKSDKLCAQGVTIDIWK
jgi:hypothetical protein